MVPTGMVRVATSTSTPCCCCAICALASGALPLANMPRATKAVMPATISAPASKMIFFMSIGPYRLPAGNSIRLCAKMVKERFAKRPGGSRDDGETVRYFGLSKPALPAVANHHGEGEQTSRERHDDHQFEEPPDRKPERERCKELHVAAAHQAEGEEPGEDDERAHRNAKLDPDVRPQLQPRDKPGGTGKHRNGQCEAVRGVAALGDAEGRLAKP